MGEATFINPEAIAEAARAAKAERGEIEPDNRVPAEQVSTEPDIPESFDLSAPTEQTEASAFLDAFRIEDRVVEIPLKGGRVVKARIHRDAGAVYQMEKGASQFVSTIKGGTMVAAWKPYETLPGEILRMAYYVHKLCVEPQFTQLEAARMAKECGALLPFIFGRLMAEQASNVAEGETEALDRLGEGSSGTPSTATS